MNPPEIIQFVLGNQLVIRLSEIYIDTNTFT